MVRTALSCSVGLVLFIAASGCMNTAAGPSDAEPEPSATVDAKGLKPAHIVGKVVDPELVPIPDVTVSVRPGDAYATTDAAGAFDVGPLEPGNIAILAERTGYVSQTVEVTLAPDKGLELTLVLQPATPDVPYHESIPKKMYIICALALRIYQPSVADAPITAPCAGLVDLVLQTATGQHYTNTLDNWTFDFTIQNPGFKTLVMEMTWPEQQFGKNGLLQLSTLATAAGSGAGVTVGGTVYGGSMAQPYRDIIHAGNSYWVDSNGKNVTFYPEANKTQPYEMLVAGYSGNTSVPAGGSAVFINFTPTVWLTMFYNRQGTLEFSALPNK
jgi:hypothetical protein